MKIKNMMPKHPVQPTQGAEEVNRVIEHAKYICDAWRSYMKAWNERGEALCAHEDNGGNRDDMPDAQGYDEAVSDCWGGITRAVHEFEKRADRLGIVQFVPPEQSDENVAELCRLEVCKHYIVEYNCLTAEIQKTQCLVALSDIIARHVQARHKETFASYAEIEKEKAELEARNKKLVEALKECADDLEAYVHAEYPQALLKSPDNQRKFVRDMQPVVNARAALTQPASGEKAK